MPFDPKAVGILEAEKVANPVVKKARRMSQEAGSCTLNEHLERKRKKNAEEAAAAAKIQRKKLACEMRKQARSGEAESLLAEYLACQEACARHGAS